MFQHRHLLKKLFMIVLAGFVLTNCGVRQKYTILYNLGGTSSGTATNDIVDISKNIKRFRFEKVVDSSVGAKNNFIQLLKGKVDFAITHNSISVKNCRDVKLSKKEIENENNLRVVAPLYGEKLFIIYPDSLKAKSLPELMEGRRIGVGPKTSALKDLLVDLMEHYKVDINKCTFVNTPYKQNKVTNNKIDVSCFLTDYNDKTVRAQLSNPDLVLFDLDASTTNPKLSSAEGFRIFHPEVHTFIIPAKLYGHTPKKPAITIGVSAVLLTHKDVHKHKVYDLIDNIFKFNSKGHILNRMEEDFDPDDLHYAIHEGTTLFQDRNRPTFIERYSKPIASGLSVLIAGFAAFMRWRNNRRYRLLREFYQRALELEKRINQKGGEAFYREAFAEILAIKAQVYDLLIEGKIQVNDNFLAFQALINNLILQLTISDPESAKIE
ncbi:hypothetical protein BKI52_31500 [marine bacterium AO1-C]|nr:hypothetical protein BKI52_31500 [marine bacterium AO1-C]